MEDRGFARNGGYQVPLIGVDKRRKIKNKRKEIDIFFNPEILIPDLRFTISDFTKIGSCRNVPEEKFEIRFEKRMTK